MPFRTKDFLLLLLTIAFLVVGITSTIKKDLAVVDQAASVGLFNQTNDPDVVYTVVLDEAPKEDTKSSRLAALREKIRGFVLPEPEPEITPEEPTPVEEPSVAVKDGDIDICTGYSVVTKLWSPAQLNFEVVEGARIVYREGNTSESVIDTMSSGTAPYTPVRDVVLQLPLRTAPLSTKTCIGSDVVGIALDGSLIRNNEHNLYTVFGGDTLVGYALDGFAIYGLADDITTDVCGGAVVAGEYRYYLSEIRDGVLGCFGGIPVTI